MYSLESNPWTANTNTACLLSDEIIVFNNATDALQSDIINKPHLLSKVIRGT